MRKAIIGLAALSVFASGEALAQSGWRVSESSGDVRVIANGQARPVSRGMLLASGSTIASGARARAVLVSGRDYVILSPASRVRLPAIAHVIPASVGSAGNMTQILTEAGTALFRIERRPNPHFQVRTPYLAAVVKGTVFSVTVNRSGASVQVTEGAVEVSTVDGGAAELIRPGMVATVEAGDLMELNIQGESSRSIRSNGTPLPGVASVPAGEAGRYDGPAETIVEVEAPVREEPVSLADTTDGLLSGQANVDLALADVRDARPGNGGGDNGDSGGSGGNGNGGPGNGGPGNGDNGNGNGNGGPGNGGPGNGDNGNGGPGNGDNGYGGPGNGGPGNGNGGPGNGGPGNGDNGGPGNGDNGGPGNGDDGGPGNDGGDGDDGNNGHGNDDDGDDDSNPGNGGGNGNGGPGNGNGGGNGGGNGNGNGGGRPQNP